MKEQFDKDIDKWYPTLCKVADWMYTKQCMNVCVKIEKNDFISMGYVGLMHRINKIKDKDHYLRFMKYILWNCRNSIIDEYRLLMQDRRSYKKHYENTVYDIDYFDKIESEYKVDETNIYNEWLSNFVSDLMLNLNESQRIRITNWIFKGKSQRAIGIEQNVNEFAIFQSINCGCIKLARILNSKGITKDMIRGEV